MVEVLNCIYEVDFLGFSYGCRPGRGPHDALDALYAGLLTRKVNWVLEADIRGVFDAIDHGWLVKFVEHRIADRLVYAKVKDRLGGRLRLAISGGAPLSAEIAEFFHACGILIVEGYGLTE